MDVERILAQHQYNSDRTLNPPPAPSAAAVRRAQLVADITLGQVHKLEAAADARTRVGSWNPQAANTFHDYAALVDIQRP
jgi:hypothetical protein